MWGKRRSASGREIEGIRTFSSMSVVCAFLSLSKASGACGLLVLSGWIRRDFMR